MHLLYKTHIESYLFEKPIENSVKWMFRQVFMEVFDESH